jgi:two-component system nitrogen regulation response regulator GlnG/two-component system response regulator HydG
MSDATVSDHGFLPERSAEQPSDARPVLILAWSMAEPHRAGEVVPLEGKVTVVGRGRPDLGAGETQARLFRQRPGASEPQEPLAGRALSRRQMVVRRTGDRVSIHQEGRGDLRVNGRAVDEAEVVEGDTICLADQVLFLVAFRDVAWLARRAERVRFSFGKPDSFGMVGESPAAWRLRQALATFAALPGHALLLGASGTGKELASRAIHSLSPRATGPFVSRNAATLPEGILDAELFGNVKNYPNPGMPERRGIFGEADGGTLFLDEIGELSHALSSHLLRVLDGGEVQRLGEAAPRRLDVRVVAATNRGRDALKHDVSHRFHHEIQLPDLASRREDIPMLVEHGFAQATSELRARFVGDAGALRISPRFIDALLRQPLPGNVRELMSLVWLSSATSNGDFLDLTDDVRAKLRPVPLAVKGEPTKEAVEGALQANGGNVTRAAAALGLANRNALYRLMEKLALR